MQRTLVMTLIGADRPGLVESVANLIASHGGNWLASRMSRLGGQFAGIVQAEVPAEKEASLCDALRKLSERGLHVVAHSDLNRPQDSVAPLSFLEIVGQDRPGIVQQISQALAGFGVNVESFESECSSAAMSGETLFKARAKLSIPPACNADELRRKLEKIAGDLIVEISLEPLADASV